MAERPYVLSIAGVDPSAGAGLLADIKTFEQLQVYGLGIPTANTIQTEKNFYANQWLSSSFIMEGVKRLLDKYSVSVVKFGIIENSTLLLELCQWIKKLSPDTFIVWDPVMKSSTSYNFQREWYLSPELLDLVDAITPNTDEWQRINISPDDHPHLAVIIKGGHNEDKKGYDTLIYEGKEIEIAPQAEPAISEKHGSGCVYSSALAACIAKGENLEDACRKAKQYTEKFLASNNRQLGYHYGTTALHIAG